MQSVDRSNGVMLFHEEMGLVCVEHLLEKWPDQTAVTVYEFP
jgi:hypothetical protein